MKTGLLVFVALDKSFRQFFLTNWQYLRRIFISTLKIGDPLSNRNFENYEKFKKLINFEEENILIKILDSKKYYHSFYNFYFKKLLWLLNLDIEDISIL